MGNGERGREVGTKWSNFDTKSYVVCSVRDELRRSSLGKETSMELGKGSRGGGGRRIEVEGGKEGGEGRGYTTRSE